ncbi:hypothetical protein Nepgr_018841 [Nepenthes gracilis]|uniref:Uncharacterized protein n=1 Tax=Nepenthes gracilis TaxID=150966 RepID=A0AAD3SS76_NEPGR|nr:hypothetical protein Nepgr_018841 [Nepenthes gracilis]
MYTYISWKKLDDLYYWKNPQKKAFLVRRFVNPRCKDGISIVEHPINFKENMNQFTNYKMVLEDECQACILSDGLPYSYETLMVAPNNSAAKGNLSTPGIREKLVW